MASRNCEYAIFMPDGEILISGLYSFLFCIYIQLQIRDSRSRLGNSCRRPIFSRIFIPALFILISLHVILSTVTLYELLRSQTLTDFVSGINSFTEPDAHYFAFVYFKSVAFYSNSIANLTCYLFRPVSLLLRCLLLPGALILILLKTG
ncbi:hypothetical protein GYMLUDRAFT_705022 [Collybiopsis luxurians FD-317 M1]|uniref:Uncharacterized protein n=1 Tax=Collybiopsis luxurians FD-317 M1 TaxID=944289 RepID=A0A0D0C6C8_9AGAR|nr:hypothetical protein GYMLUDRAFT_705022 [Collybiopsis luxurians FD-317 M1]